MPGEFGKNRQWTAVLYNENMRAEWKEEIDYLLQLPFAYCVHDKGLEIEKQERRKIHTHIILVFPAPTTYKHAVEVFSRLSADGKRAFNTIEPVYNARNMYDYLIHDTDDCRKKGKYQFPKEERVVGNCYDIGSYEQVSQADKNEVFDLLTDLIFTGDVTNFADFVLEARNQYPDRVELIRDVMRSYSGYFDRLIKGNYFRIYEKLGSSTGEVHTSYQAAGEDHGDGEALAMQELRKKAGYFSGKLKEFWDGLQQSYTSGMAVDADDLGVSGKDFMDDAD